MPASDTFFVMPRVADVSAAFTMMASTFWEMKFCTWLSWRPTSPCASSNLTVTSPLVSTSCWMASRILTRNRCSKRDSDTPTVSGFAIAGEAMNMVTAHAVRSFFTGFPPFLWFDSDETFSDWPATSSCQSVGDDHAVIVSKGRYFDVQHIRPRTGHLNRQRLEGLLAAVTDWSSVSAHRSTSSCQLRLASSDLPFRGRPSHCSPSSGSLIINLSTTERLTLTHIFLRQL